MLTYRAPTFYFNTRDPNKEPVSQEKSDGFPSCLFVGIWTGFQYEVCQVDGKILPTRIKRYKNVWEGFIRWAGDSLFGWGQGSLLYGRISTKDEHIRQQRHLPISNDQGIWALMFCVYFSFRWLPAMLSNVPRFSGEGKRRNIGLIYWKWWNICIQKGAR